jgi:hemerythrin
VTEDWEPASLGDDRLDGQHRLLVRRLRTLTAAVAAGKLDEVRATLRILSLSLAEHWRDEERWMEESGYPGLNEHKRHHDDLLHRLAEAIEPKRQVVLAPVASSLAREVEGHMRNEDVKLGRFFAARANFKAMAEGKSGNRGPALTPLPGALGILTPPPKKKP